MNYDGDVDGDVDVDDDVYNTKWYLSYLNVVVKIVTIFLSKKDDDAEKVDDSFNSMI
jgi:hypothetical protein